MQNIKSLFISIVSSIAIFSAPLSASSAPSGSFDPVVEIYNKEGESIQVNLIDVSGSTQKAITTAYVSGNRQWNSGPRVIDMNNKMLIEVLKQNKLIGRFLIDAPGKTKYLSWNPAKSPALYPQTGPLMGLMSKTDSGLSLKNNVSASQIRKQ
jgi:hypothetical protein